jgi:hypothetical protein
MQLRFVRLCPEEVREDATATDHAGYGLGHCVRLFMLPAAQLPQ